MTDNIRPHKTVRPVCAKKVSKILTKRQTGIDNEITICYNLVTLLIGADRYD